VRAIYVQLLQAKQLDSRVYRPGDWVEVGKQAALKWIAEGSARAIGPIKLDADARSGILVRGAVGEAKARLDKIGYGGGLQGVPLDGPVSLPWNRTLVWSADVRLRIDLIGAGFGLLERWEVAVPLLSAQGLASEVGDESERALTAELIHDLRVPAYQSGAMFVRRTEATEEMLAAWQAERARGPDEHLALLRAIYQVKPLVLALPATWIE
jgi:hypothetical protein